MRTRLQELRFKRNISQLQVSIETGIHFSSLSRLENGWSRGTAEQRRKIAKFFKVRECWLFPGSSKAV